MEAGFVCEWQVASCSEGSPSAKHVRTHNLLTFFIGNIWRESPLPYPRMIMFGILHGFARRVHSIDVLKGDDGIHRQATVDHKDLAHGKRRFQLQLIAPKGSKRTLK